MEARGAADLGTLQMQVLSRVTKGRLCLRRNAARAAACQVLHKRVLICLQASVVWQDAALWRIALPPMLCHVGLLAGGGVLVRGYRLLVLPALSLLLLLQKCELLVLKPLLKRAILAAVVLLAVLLCHVGALQRGYLI